MTQKPAASVVRTAAVVLGTVAIAFLLTVALRPALAQTPFVFEYGAVAASAAYCGLTGGAAATVLSALLVDYYLIPPAHSLAIKTVPDGMSLLAFAAVATVITLLAESMRRARHNAELHARRIADQAAELAVQQTETESLAEELEHSNVELETALEDSTEARNAAVAGEERFRLLDEASRVLTSSLDYETTLASAAQLAVPNFADWATVDLLVDGQIKQLAIAHVDPEKVRWARELSERYPVHPDATTGVPAVIRSGDPQLIATVTDEMLVAGAIDEEHLAILREVGIYSVVIAPMIARGQTLGAITFVSSRPDRHFGEAELRLAMELARRAAVAIDNARLYQAAVAANEAKANFLATMSHELRTPLTAIIGYEELLIDEIPGAVNEVQRQQLQRIKASAGHLLSLIDEILLFARVEAGRESLRLEPVVAKGVVEDAIAFVAPTAKDRPLELRTEPIDPALMLRTDSGKLRQILVNLIANAVKFTPRGQVTVRAFGRADSVVFEVEDTGIGVAREHLDHIFDPFWQVEQNTTRKIGGSGLGLSVTRRLARLLDGDVTVKSELGKGSVFRIVVPKRLEVRAAERESRIA